MSDFPSAQPAPPEPVIPPPPQAVGSRLASLAVASALFIEFVDSTALSTALPTLAQAFNADPVHLKLALTSYILALAVFVPVSGWAAERFGPRRVFLVAMAVFLTGSVLCGFSDSLFQLVAFRVLQGMGGAMMVPVARLIVVGSTPKERLLKAMGWFTIPGLVGPLVGPPMAGFVLAVADWPWIFWLNVPVGLLGMLAVTRFVPRIETPDPGRFDWSGFLLSAVAITCLVTAAETAGVGLVPWPWLVALAAAALASGTGYFFLARRKIRPILDLGLMRHATFRASLLGGLVVRMGSGAGPFLLPMLLQVGLGWTPLQAGSVTLAGGLGVIFARPFAAFLLRRIGFRAMLTLFILLSALVTAATGLLTRTTPVEAILVLLFVGGFIRASQFISANTLAYSEAPPEKIAAATTFFAVSQQVGMALGVSFGGLMLHLARGSGELTPSSFVLPYVAVGAVMLLAAPIYLRLDPKAGANISGHRRSEER
ncbi:MAG TPA: MFS transporter [Caulobacter sp.]|nr:MFS transporter [Caulobacter sp.]